MQLNCIDKSLSFKGTSRIFAYKDNKCYFSYICSCNKHSQSAKTHGQMTTHSNMPINGPISIRSCSYPSHFFEIQSKIRIKSHFYQK